MLPFWAIAVGSYIMFCVMAAMQPLERIYNAYDARIKVKRIQVIGSAIRSRYLENPAGGLLTPAALEAVPGYEYLNSYKAELFQTGTATNLNDTVWRYSRFAIYIQKNSSIIDPADYLLAANNTCGSGDFSVSASWCGSDDSLWLKYETRNENTALILAEKQRLVRVVSLFYRRFSADRKFTSLAVGSYTTLAALTGYAGSSAGCSGVLVYQGIPFTCDDLFNAWGIPVVINQVSLKRIALVNRTGVINSNGQPIRLAEEAILE